MIVCDGRIVTAADLASIYRRAIRGMTVTQTRRGRRRVINTVAAARELGVSRQHLYLVIRGERQSPRIDAWLQRNLREGKKP